MDENRITEYWSNYFGIDIKEMNSNGISIVPHKFLHGFNGAWIFKRENRIIISSREKDIQILRERIQLHPPSENEIFSNAYLEKIFRPNIQKIIGPTFQGFYDSEQYNCIVSENVIPIRFEEFEKEIFDLSNTGDAEGWLNSGLGKKSNCMYGYVKNNSILAMANYKIVQGDAGFIGVYTNPIYRGKGHGQEVVRKIVNDLTEKGKLVIYQTLLSNLSAKGIAEKVGIVEFARNIAIRFK